MENKLLYRRIVNVALMLVVVLSVLVGVVIQSLIYALSLIYGGALGVLGFLWIVAMTSNIEAGTNAQKIVLTHYVIRYLMYLGCLLLGIYIHLDIISMLVGFVCINLSIKFNVYKNGKEEE